jgi:BNR repeat-like domain
MVHAGRGRARNRPPRPAPSLLEPGAASGGRGPAPAVLQGRAQPAALVGHAIRLGRWRAQLVCGPASTAPVVLGDGSLLCPSSTEHLGWRARLERTADLGESWEKLRPLNRWRELGAIQPCILAYPSGRMQVLCRTRQRVIAACWSSDGGRTWGSMQATSLPNPDSGIDAVALHDGRALLAYNPSRAARTPLCLAVSSDGVAWRNVLVLADGVGEYSYPAIIQGQDRSLHVTYTWNRRRIRYGRLSPDEISERDSSAP